MCNSDKLHLTAKMNKTIIIIIKICSGMVMFEYDGDDDGLIEVGFLLANQPTTN